MSHSGVPGASVLSQNPKYNPLGGFGATAVPILADAAAVALAPETGGLSLAVPAIYGGYDLSQGNYLGAAGQALSVGLGGYNAFTGLGAEGATTGAGAASTLGANAYGSSLSDYLSNVGGNLSNTFGNLGNSITSGISGVGSDISSDYNNVMNYLGLGGGTSATDTGTIAGSVFAPTPTTSVLAGSGAGTSPLFNAPLSNYAGGIDTSLQATNPSAYLDTIFNNPTLNTPAGATGAVVQPGTPTQNPASPNPATINNLLSNPSGSTGGAVTPAAAAGTGPTISGGATAAAPSGGVSGILDSISKFTSAHPYLTLGGSMIGSQLLSPLISKIAGTNNLTPQEQALLAQEQPGLNAANSLIGSEQSGVLPPGAQASVQSALQADIANIKSRYASLGMSGSSAEQQDIANAQQQSVANQFALANQATQTGLSALGLNQNVYQTLVTDQLNRQQQLQNAFSGLFSAIGQGTALGATLNSKAAA